MNFDSALLKIQDVFCHDLPTSPLPDMGKILVTGASGYIGGRLVPELIIRGYEVRIMVRGGAGIFREKWPEVEIAVVDALKNSNIEEALDDIDTAFYLIHSLRLGPEYFEYADILAAKNFREAACNQNIKRIIYLGGICGENVKSNHLKNRLKVRDELCAGKVPVTFLRAAIIIGSGGASYEIIHSLVNRMPVLLFPKWAQNYHQPIALRDVIKYLVGSLETKETIGQTFDICQEEKHTYEQMLKIFASIINRKILFIRIPALNIKLYSYMVSLLTPVPMQITSCLMEGLSDEIIGTDSRIKDLIPFKTLNYREAVVLALTREEQDQVYTRWSDAYPPAHILAIRLYELDKKNLFQASYSISTNKNISAVFISVCNIGGDTGWFNNNILWQARGLIDRLFFGVGLSRGRKRVSNLIKSDVIDFWRVEDIRTDKRLLLRAEMKLPGKAWLEFNLDKEKNRTKLTVTAHYDASGFFGKAYWYFFLPFHHMIFVDLIKQVVRRA